MTRPIPTELQKDFALVVSNLRHTFGEDLIGVYALVEDAPFIIAVVEDEPTEQQRTNIGMALLRALNRAIGLRIHTKAHLKQGHPYESAYAYDPELNANFTEGDRSQVANETDLTLGNTALLRTLHQRGHTLLGDQLLGTLPAISDDDYRVALRYEAQRRIRELPQYPTRSILHLCRILAFWRIKRILTLDEVGAWSLRNLDPRFQTLIERASMDYQSGSEPSAYNTYQLDQFAEYVQDMLLR